jgi:cyclopropane-fatty-acyl-phospholipid synthase
MVRVYGKDNADIWLQRWRIFFMACSELFGTPRGEEWLVLHYLLKKEFDVDRFQMVDQKKAV